MAGKSEKVNQTYTKAERAHIERIKAMPCIVCGTANPSDAHHVRQDSAYYCIPLCKDCHQGPQNGWHGRKAMWRIHKMDEIDALAKLIRRLT